MHVSQVATHLMTRRLSDDVDDRTPMEGLVDSDNTNADDSDNKSH